MLSSQNFGWNSGVAEPTELSIPDGAFAIALGDDHAVIVGSLGQVGCYGTNMCGQVGLLPIKGTAALQWRTHHCVKHLSNICDFDFKLQ